MSNREIDALIAEKVFGMEVCRVHHSDMKPGQKIANPRRFPAFVLKECSDGRFSGGVFVSKDDYANGACRFSIDPAASKQLRDKMRELGWMHESEDVRQVAQDPLEHRSRFRKWGSNQSETAVAETEMMADSLAALKALGVQVE